MVQLSQVTKKIKEFFPSSWATKIWLLQKILSSTNKKKADWTLESMCGEQGKERTKYGKYSRWWDGNQITVKILMYLVGCLIKEYKEDSLTSFQKSVIEKCAFALDYSTGSFLKMVEDDYEKSLKRYNSLKKRID